MFTKKNKENAAITELKEFIGSCPEKINACGDLAQYMATVRAPLNLRLIDLALGVNLMSKGEKRSVKVAKLLKDEEALEVNRILTNFIATMETPFLESLEVPDEGIPLTQAVEMPKEIKRSKKGILSMVFTGSQTATPLCQQLLMPAVIQEMIIFGKEFHKKVLRNHILIGAGVTLALIGLGVGTYYLVLKKRKKADKDDDCDCDCDECACDSDVYDGEPLDGIDMDATPIVALS